MEVTRSEFTLFMLIEMGKVTQDDIDGLYANFQQLDVTGDGSLTEEDLKMLENVDIQMPC